MLEKVNEAARLVGLVLGADIEAGDNVDERNVAFLIEEDLQAVVENEIPARLGGGEGSGGEPEAGEKEACYQMMPDHTKAPGGSESSLT
jgi:hypothetical protein